MSNPVQRIDKWLWFARLAKTRTLAAGLVTSGRIRLNRAKVAKPSTPVKPGDVITASLGRRVRIVKIMDVGQRRGPATEAATLFEDLTPTDHTVRSEDGVRSTQSTAVAERPQGAGRPTKRERRLTDLWRGRRR